MDVSKQSIYTKAMDPSSEISDEEFVPFLHDLGVETYKKSFEWMLNDTNFSGVLRWMYKNLDHNNALTAREEYRYTELEKKGGLLPQEDLETSIAKLKDEYPGLCMPGDQESREDIELDVEMQKERLNVLTKHEIFVMDLIKQNELIKEELTLELARLNAAHHQCLEDEGVAADECTSLAQELETIANEVIDVIADNLEVYTSCKSDKDMATRFFVFAPLESYRQTQALFRSHFDLYVSKHLMNRQNSISDDELRATLVEAKIMEDRLSDAAFEYLVSKAELSGEQAKQNLVANYNNVHPSQITAMLMENQSALDLLEQEESVIEQEMQNLVQQLVRSRTSLAVNTVTSHAIDVRQQMLSSLTYLVDAWQQAYSLDRLLYLCLRQEHRTLEEFVQFATQLSQYVITENRAVADRISSMSEIIGDQDSCQLDSPLTRALTALCDVTRADVTDDVSALVKLYDQIKGDVRELSDGLDDGFRRKEDCLMAMRRSSQPLKERIWDGCTKQPNCWDRTVSSMQHALIYKMENIDKRVVEASSLFTSVKNGDKQSLRKLWQWFLTDPGRLLAAMKTARGF